MAAALPLKRPVKVGELVRRRRTPWRTPSAQTLPYQEKACAAFDQSASAPSPVVGRGMEMNETREPAPRIRIRIVRGI